MIKRRATIAIMGGICALALAAAATPAGAAVAYLSNNAGGDCSSATTPCGSMISAVTTAGTNGEVICLNKGSYGGVEITSSVTISCGDGLWEAPNQNDQVIINTPAGSDVVIEGLVIDGRQALGNSITAQGQGALHLRRVRSGNNRGGTHGLSFTPNGPATLDISDSVFYHNDGAGLFIQPTGSGSAQVTIDRTHFEKNSLGIVVDGTISSGSTQTFIRDSVITGTNGPGVAAKASTVSLDRSSVVNNNFGVIANNGGAALLSNSTIQGNGTAFAVAGGAATFSYGNNNINANGAFGLTPTVVGQH
jgi:hypothetical protein